MCTNLQYYIWLKPEFDKKFKFTGKRAKIIPQGSVVDVQSGKIKLNYPKKYYNLMIMPCGQCIDCRIQLAAKKSAQASLEARSHKENCFITLTFDRNRLFEFLKKERKLSDYKAKKHTAFMEWSLENKEFTLFMKRLRQYVRRQDIIDFCLKNKSICEQYMYTKKGFLKKSITLPVELMKKIKFHKVRLLHCGEYGSLGYRPHHHAIIFGYDFNDCYDEKYYKQGKVCFRRRSTALNKLWTLGDSSVDTCNYNSINYVSRYCLKKINGVMADSWYQGRKKEFVTQSNRRGLGYEYFMEHFKEYVNGRKVTVKTKKGKYIEIGLPRYFRNLWKQKDPESYYKYVDSLFKTQNARYQDIINSYGDFESYSLHRKSCADYVLHKCVRVLERIDVNDRKKIDLVKNKAAAFGIDENVLNLYRPFIGKYLDSKSYKNFENKIVNLDKFKLYKQFEDRRKRLLCRYIDKEDVVNIDVVKNLKNPYINYLKTKYVYEDRQYLWSSIFEVGVALYA